MKLVIIITGFFLHLMYPPSSIYDMQIQTVEGNTIALSAYTGSKIMIATCNAAAPDTSFLTSLEAIKAANNNVRIVLIPATDLSVADSSLNMLEVKTGLNLSYEISLLAAVKNGSASQHELIKWLTTDTENAHFDLDVSNEGQLFFISEKGSLYTVTAKTVEPGVIQEILNQTINE